MTANRTAGTAPVHYAAAGAAELRLFLRGVRDRHPDEPLHVLCIGSDRSTGDSLGPLVGTMLEERGLRGVTGTLRRPCDADRLPGAIRSLPSGAVVVAIDACLGRPENVGRYLLGAGPLQPARSVGAALPPVGDYSVAAVVAEYGPQPYRTLQTTSLYAVLQMAGAIADAICDALGGSPGSGPAGGGLGASGDGARRLFAGRFEFGGDSSLQ